MDSYITEDDLIYFNGKDDSNDINKTYFDLWGSYVWNKEIIVEDKCGILQRIPIIPCGMYMSIPINKNFDWKSIKW